MQLDTFNDAIARFEEEQSFENAKLLTDSLSAQITWLVTRKTEKNFLLVLTQLKTCVQLLNKVKDPEILALFVNVVAQFCIEGQPNHYPDEEFHDFIEIPQEDEDQYKVVIAIFAGEFLDLLRVTRLLFPLRQQIYSEAFSEERVASLYLLVMNPSLDVFKYVFQDRLGSFAKDAFELIKRNSTPEYETLVRQLAVILVSSKYGHKSYNFVKSRPLEFFLFTGIGTFLTYVFAIIKAYKKSHIVTAENAEQAMQEIKAIVDRELQKNGSIYTYMRIDINDMRVVERSIYKDFKYEEDEFASAEFTDEYANQVLNGQIPYHEYVPSGSKGVCPATQLMDSTDEKPEAVVKRLVDILFVDMPEFVLFSQELTDEQMMDWYRTHSKTIKQ